MNVLFLSPGFPSEMPFFVRGLASVGAGVIGIGEQPRGALPPMAQAALDHYVQVDSLWDEDRLVQEARTLAARQRIDRVECLWEPGVLVAARLREELGLPGLGVERARPFRDKGLMKQVLDNAGIRTPRHARADSDDACRRAAEEIGYPLIVKPIAGAGSADTHRIDDVDDLERVLPSLRHVGEVSVEEFIEGEEFTFDTICAEGRVLYSNVSWYRPCPLVARSIEWVSPQTVCLRHPDSAHLREGARMGHAVIEALGFDTGFTHMEWFLTPDGEAVFGEIGARPPGALSVDIMNYSCDFDSQRAWAEALTAGRLSAPIDRRYNAAVIFKRARGEGRIQRIEGLERIVARFRPHIVSVDLRPVGAPRRNWKQTLLSDGHLILRHPDLGATLEMADRVASDVRMFAE